MEEKMQRKIEAIKSGYSAINFTNNTNAKIAVETFLMNDMKSFRIDKWAFVKFTSNFHKNVYATEQAWSNINNSY